MNSPAPIGSNANEPCDFCSSPAAEWQFICLTEDFPRDWFACEGCYALIQARNLDALARLSASRYPGAKPRGAFLIMRDIIAGFLEGCRYSFHMGGGPLSLYRPVSQPALPTSAPTE